MLHVVITDESVWIWKGHSKVSTFEKVPIHYGHLSLIISLLTTDSFKCFDILSEATLNMLFVSHIHIIQYYLK